MNKKVADFLYNYLIYSYFQEINDTEMRELSIIAFSQPFDKLFDKPIKKLFTTKINKIIRISVKLKNFLELNYLILNFFIRGTNFKISKCKCID